MYCDCRSPFYFCFFSNKVTLNRRQEACCSSHYQILSRNIFAEESDSCISSYTSTLQVSLGANLATMVANSAYCRLPYNIQGYRSFSEFYPYYLGEHADTTCRRLHVVGTSFVVALLATATFTVQPQVLMALPFVGYGMAWTGHFFFEKNKPATFKHPFYSLMGDFKLWWEVITRQRAF